MRLWFSLHIILSCSFWLAGYINFLPPSTAACRFGRGSLIMMLLSGILGQLRGQLCDGFAFDARYKEARLFEMVFWLHLTEPKVDIDLFLLSQLYPFNEADNQFPAVLFCVNEALRQRLYLSFFLLRRFDRFRR